MSVNEGWWMKKHLVVLFVLLLLPLCHNTVEPTEECRYHFFIPLTLWGQGLNIHLEPYWALHTTACSNTWKVYLSGESLSVSRGSQSSPLPSSSASYSASSSDMKGWTELQHKNGTQKYIREKFHLHLQLLNNHLYLYSMMSGLLEITPVDSEENYICWFNCCREYHNTLLVPSCF